MAENTNAAATRISRLFSTPIATHRVVNADELNRGLKEIILTEEANKPSTGRSNIGGWRSEHDLLARSEPQITALCNEIREAIGHVFQATAGANGFSGYFAINGWANVLRRGNYNTPHNHPESAWSGVYYVDIGTQNAEHPLSGMLEFMDPRPFVEMVSTPGMPFGLPVRIQPEAGLMVVFPSWLYHHVHAYMGEGARIAIAFNIPTHGAAPGQITAEGVR